MKVSKNHSGRYDINKIPDSFKKNKKTLKGVAAYSKFWGVIAACFGFALKCKDEETGSTVYLIKSSAVKYLKRHEQKVNSKDNKAILRMLENLGSSFNDGASKTKNKIQTKESADAFLEDAHKLLENENAQDHIKGLSLIQRAAEKGSNEAMINLAGLFLHGMEGIEINKTLGLEWLNKAVLNGSNEAMVLLAEAYLNGKHRVFDKKLGLEWYEKAAEQGSEKVKHDLAMIYLQKKFGVDVNLTRGLEWLEKSAKQGSKEAQFQLPRIYLEGLYGIEVNVQAALDAYEMAAEQGSNSAITNLVDIYLKGEHGVTVDAAKALAWFDKSQNKTEDTYADFAKYFLEAKEYEKAAQFYMNAKDYIASGKIYYKKLKNYEKAIDTFCQSEDPYAKFQLSKIYREEGPLKNEELAKTWLVEAAPLPDDSGCIDGDPFAYMEMYHLMMAENQKDKAKTYLRYAKLCAALNRAFFDQDDKQELENIVNFKANRA